MRVAFGVGVAFDDSWPSKGSRRTGGVLIEVIAFCWLIALIRVALREGDESDEQEDEEDDEDDEDDEEGAAVGVILALICSWPSIILLLLLELLVLVPRRCVDCECCCSSD
jgi:hypothetical protein